MNDSKIKKVTTVMVTFTEFETTDKNGDSYEIVVTATSKVRIDSAMGIMTLGIGVLQSCPDAYLDPEAIGGWTKDEGKN